MVEETARAIETMEIRGAGSIARAAAEALKREAYASNRPVLVARDEVEGRASRAPERCGTFRARE